MVRGTFSPTRAWRPAVVARLARTLGSARRAMWHSSRISACRRGLNSHDAAEPRIRSGPRQRTMQRSSAQCKNVEHARRDMSRGAARSSDKAPPCHRETPHCVGDPGFQSVRGPAAASDTASIRGPLRQRLECAARHRRRRGAGGDRGAQTGATRPWPAHRPHSPGAALPNPSLKWSANGRPPGPVCGALHSPQPGPGVLPLAPP